MNEFQTYEVTTHQRIQGIWLIKRITLVFIYIAFVIAALLLGFLTRISVPLLAFIPIALWLLIFITWRYTDVDYEYSMTSGYLSFSRIYGLRSRKQLFEAHIKSMSLIAPYNDDYYEKVRSYAPDVEYYALSEKDAANAYFALFENNAIFAVSCNTNIALPCFTGAVHRTSHKCNLNGLIQKPFASSCLFKSI